MRPAFAGLFFARRSTEGQSINLIKMSDLPTREVSAKIVAERNGVEA